MSGERERGRRISLEEAMEGCTRVFAEAQARRAADRAAEERDGDDGSRSSAPQAMSAVAAGIIATLTRERDEARAVGRELLGRLISMAHLAGMSPLIFEPDPAEAWKAKHPWLQEGTSGDPD